MFLVRSLGTGVSRRRDPVLSSQRYLVHLNVWNCTCPSFTFDAFPVHPVPMSDDGAHDETRDLGRALGGIGLGTGDGVPPFCKHLLACLLVDKWEDMLGGYVEERSVTRDEMAGIVADL